MSQRIPRETAEGLLCIPDAHLAGSPPGQRLETYTEDILTKVGICLREAKARNLLPVFLGDLFHWPRENPNQLLVRIIELFEPYRPWCLIGNHDKYQARFTDDVSMAVLEAAGAVRLMKEAGPAFWLETPSGPVLVGASPDGFPIPSGWEKSGQEIVVWLTHHNIDFPDFNEKRVKMRELSGIDWVINGHIHRPQPTVTKGQTRWANPGNITRLTFNRATAERKPAASIWRPGAADLERLELPHKPFAEVFPDQELPEETPPEVVSDSGFLQGLERLRWRRTKEGAGLKEFLQANLNPERPETAVIWELYREVVDR